MEGLRTHHFAGDGEGIQFSEERLDEGLGGGFLGKRQEEAVVDAGDFAHDVGHVQGLAEDVELPNIAVQGTKAATVGIRHGYGRTGLGDGLFTMSTHI